MFGSYVCLYIVLWVWSQSLVESSRVLRISGFLWRQRNINNLHPLTSANDYFPMKSKVSRRAGLNMVGRTMSFHKLVIEHWTTDTYRTVTYGYMRGTSYTLPKSRAHLESVGIRPFVCLKEGWLVFAYRFESGEMFAKCYHKKHLANISPLAKRYANTSHPSFIHTKGRTPTDSTCRPTQGRETHKGISANRDLWLYGGSIWIKGGEHNHPRANDQGGAWRFWKGIWGISQGKQHSFQAKGQDEYV